MATKAGTQNGSQGSVIPPQAFSHEGVEVLHRLVHAASEAATREALLGRAVKTLVDHNEWSWGAVWAQSDGRWKKGPSAGRLGAQLARHDNLPTTASGLLGEAAQHRSFVFYSALTQGPQDCALCSTAAREGAASGLAIPLAIGDQVRTVLALFSRHERNDEDWNRSTWESVGTLLATTLSLRAELGERAAEIEAISRAQAVVEFNLEGEVLAANENFLASVGYSLAEVKGKHHKTFVEPQYAQSDEYARFWRGLAAGKVQTGRFSIIGKHGKNVWAEASYVPIFDGDGAPVKVVKYATDVTDSVAAEQLNSELAQVAAASPPLIYADNAGTIRYINDRARDSLLPLERHLPTEVCKLVGTDFSFFGQGDEDPHNAAYRRLSLGDELLALSDRQVCDASGQPIGMLVTWEVVTEQVRLQDEVHRISNMMESSPTNVVFANPQGTIEYMNRASREAFVGLEKYLPCRVDEIVGNSFDIFHKNPARQRGIVADPTRLPHRGVIDVGPEKLDLLVSAIMDNSGKYIGAILNWSIVTKKLEIEQTVKASAATLGTSADDLSGNSKSMLKNANDTAARATSVAAASEEVSVNIQTVASSVEEMSASIREIARNAAAAAEVATKAVLSAEHTNHTISKLGDSSAEIGKVIKVITSIAQQTNLLALNATIEAARAGEAGKGFAVVANEVKELAKETARATEDIGQKIEAIQTNTTGAVEAIGQITEIISQINDIQNTIAGAVEEQSATTNEITRNVAEAAKGSTTITENVVQVAQAADTTTTGARSTEESAAALAKLAADLLHIVA